ncbi:MAG: molybdopterin-dependent oxidoreductase, partial [Nisaea sp.]
EKALDSELSANVIDLCPVGALTSKPYAFVARPWELRKTETIDVMDALGSNIRVDARGSEVLRVLPRLHEEVNEEWISDKTRYACDGLKRQRLDRPYLRKDGKLQPVSWDDAFAAIAAKLKGLKGDEVAAVAGDTVDVESMFALQGVMAALGSPNLDCRQDGAKLDATTRAGYLFNATIAGIEDADAILIVGANPRWDAAVLNARIRKRWLEGGLKVGVIGAPVDLTYKYDHLGAGTQTLTELADGKNAFASVLKDAKRPMIILGMGALTRDDGAAVLATARNIAESTGMLVPASKDEEGNEVPAWNGFSVLHTAASRVGGLDIGFLPGKGGADVAGMLDGASKGTIKAVYLLGADEIDTQRLGDAFVIYQGHHGDRGAHRADVILPGAAYTEKDGLYVNTEGRVQMGLRASFPPGEAREDWAIIRALSAHLGAALPYDSLEQLRAALRKSNEIFTEVDIAPEAAWGPFGAEGEMSDTGFGTTVENFYMTDSISRASQTMAECTEVFVLSKQAKTGTEG